MLGASNTLHRRFPGFLKEGVTFGVILDHITGAGASSPLTVLQGQLPSLQALNDFAGAFHQDTAGVTVQYEVSDSELETFAKHAQCTHWDNAIATSIWRKVPARRLHPLRARITGRFLV